MLCRLRASTTLFAFVVSPASIKTFFPAGETIRIASPLTGPTSSTWTWSSPPEGGGGRCFHLGRINFQPAKTAAPITTNRTAAAHPHPRVALPTNDLAYEFRLVNYANRSRGVDVIWHSQHAGNDGEVSRDICVKRVFSFDYFPDRIGADDLFQHQN